MGRKAGNLPFSEDTGNFAFPYNENLPAQSLQKLVISNVTGHIGLEFSLPEFDVAAGNSGLSATRMLMPETSVDEDDGFVTGQNNVRLSRKVFAVKAKTVSQGMKQAAYDHLGLCVFAPDGCHVATSLFFAESIHAMLTDDGELRPSGVSYSQKSDCASQMNNSTK